MNQENIINKMKAIFKEMPDGINHTMKVLDNAMKIIDGEKIEGKKAEIIKLTAILHDIGVVQCEKKYNSIDGIYQEKECPIIAEKILNEENIPDEDIDRICFIIANHHTPSAIDDIDFQIQWEADLLENLTAMNKEKEQHRLKKSIDKNFKTVTGIKLAYDKFII